MAVSEGIGRRKIKLTKRVVDGPNRGLPATPSSIPKSAALACVCFRPAKVLDLRIQEWRGRHGARSPSASRSGERMSSPPTKLARLPTRCGPRPRSARTPKKRRRRTASAPTAVRSRLRSFLPRTSRRSARTARTTHYADILNRIVIPALRLEEGQGRVARRPCETASRLEPYALPGEPHAGRRRLDVHLRREERPCARRLQSRKGHRQVSRRTRASGSYRSMNWNGWASLSG